MDNIDYQISKIYKKYGINMHDYDMSLKEIIVKIFNSDDINTLDYDLDNIYIQDIIGLYYQYKKRNYKKALSYYLMAAEKGNVNAMFHAGVYYEKVALKYGNMEKYYLMAIRGGNTNAMQRLGYYYQNIKLDNDKAKKYYLMAIYKGDGNSNAMHSLGFLYQHHIRNYEEMKKYYLMAIEKGHAVSMQCLGYYYETINDNMDEFIYLNSLISKLLFFKKITTEESQKISNKLISENYGTKIKYLEKIKKYIDQT